MEEPISEGKPSLFVQQINRISLLKEDTSLADVTVLDSLTLKSLQDNPIESFVDTEDIEYKDNPIVLDRLIYIENDSRQRYIEVDARWKTHDQSLQTAYNEGADHYFDKLSRLTVDEYEF